MQQMNIFVNSVIITAKIFNHTVEEQKHRQKRFEANYHPVTVSQKKNHLSFNQVLIFINGVHVLIEDK